MSAYVVPTDTIDFLVTAAAKYQEHFYAPLDPSTTDALTLGSAPMAYDGNTFRLDARTDADRIGSILLAQNIRSVNYRYDDIAPIPDYTYHAVPYSQITPVDVLKSVRCLIYQSCETPDYHQSFAMAILTSIQSAAIHALNGYSDAPWGWTRNYVPEHRGA